MTRIRLIRAFDGPRHQRLRRIWEAIALYEPDVEIEWFDNPDAALSHGAAFNAIWEEERPRPERYLLLTEEDWLPNLALGCGGWTGLLDLGADDALACQYAKRGVTRRLEQWHGIPGGWFILIDKTRAPRDLDFRGRPDPGNQLAERLQVRVVPGEDCYPDHYGMRWKWGTHLFWSRHLHDPPRRVSGFPLDEIQRKHDAAVDAWVAAQPEEFRQCLGLTARSPPISQAI